MTESNGSMGFLRLPVRLQPCMYALGAAMYISTPALGQTKDVSVGRHAAATLSKERLT
jgi:hypothetical protein